ncbi:hypothetical protein SLS62_005652 [Diatrype stigma]|uniref:AB hydrolase-1 domain-containing protein n=1 Tax=Diatrype stigma TaxID=117547 RepID=A0AAN9YPI5_9PEZI
MSKRSLLLIPGAFAVPDLYDSLVNAVAAKGYEIKALHMPSVAPATGPKEGEPPTMYDDAAFIAKEAESLADEGKDVIIMTHSYGGVPGTESVRGLSKTERQKQGKKGGIVRLAYMTSLVLAVGDAATSAQGDVKEQTPFTLDDKGWLSMPDIEKVAMTFSDVPSEEALPFARRMTKHSAASFANPLTYAGYKDVPVSYLLCEEDLAISSSAQRAGIELIERESGRPVEVTSLKAGHAPTLSRPQEVEDWVVGLFES